MIILSDFSDVIARGMTGFAEAVQATWGISEEVTRQHFLEDPYNVALWWDACRDKVTETAYWTQFVEGERFQNETVESIGRPLEYYEIMEVFHNNAKIPIPGTFETFLSIRSYPMFARRSPDGKGLKLSQGRGKGMPAIAVVSDQLRDLRPILKSYHNDFFAVVGEEFWSFEMGCIKADPGFFKNVIKTLPYTPDDFILIDDNPDNLAAARECGFFNLIQFTSANDLKRELESVYQFEFYEGEP